MPNRCLPERNLKSGRASMTGMTIQHERERGRKDAAETHATRERIASSWSTDGHRVGGPDAA